MVLLVSTRPCAAADFEPPQTLKARDVLPKSFFEREFYRVDEQVRNDGLMNTYRVTSTHGDFEVHSTIALYKLIVEIEAIEAMKKVEQSDSLTESLRESGTSSKSYNFGK